MFPKTDKIPWICFRERAGTKNTDMTFIHSTRAMLRQSYCYQKYKSLERNLVALFLLNNENK